MKIHVKLIVGKQERTITIACGAGDKTFKWLGMVSSQRFAMEAPHGAIRRYDELRGITDRVQQHAFNISLSNGEEPHPGALLCDYLRDNDEVIVDLLNDLDVDKCGTPSLTNWSTVAFTSVMDDKRTGNEDKESETEQEQPIFTEEMKAKIDFMRIVLGSQMLDHTKIANQLNVHWGLVESSMPKIESTDFEKIKMLCQQHYGILFELFQRYSPEGRMNITGFQKVIEDSNIHSPRDFDYLTKKDFQRACKRCNCIDLEFGGFLCALLLTSQTVHVDRLDRSAIIYGPTDAFQLLLSRSIVPLAHALHLSYLTRETFCSSECLLNIRYLHDTLFLVFEKYANQGKRDCPTGLPIDIMTELLYDAGLQNDGVDAKAIDKTKTLLAEVKRGLIIGRSVFSEPGGTSRVRKMSLVEQFQENEFTFAEFVDASARAGIVRYASDSQPHTLMECMIQGLQDVSCATHKVLPVTKLNTKQR
eukprot:gene3838-7644_t